MTLSGFIETFDINSSHAENTTKCIQEVFMTESANLQAVNIQLSGVYDRIARLFSSEETCLSLEETAIFRYLIEDVIQIALSSKKEYYDHVSKCMSKSKKKNFKVKTNPLNTMKLPDPLRKFNK